MNREEIIRLARQSGGIGVSFDRWSMTTNELENFAALVAAAEGLACEEIVSLCCGSCAEAIRARGDK